MNGESFTVLLLMSIVTLAVGASAAKNLAIRKGSSASPASVPSSDAVTGY